MRTPVVGIVLMGLLVVAVGCRQEPPEPRFNRNLGDAPGELMPVRTAAADPRILEDQTGVQQEAFTVPARNQPPKRGAERGRDRPGPRGAEEPAEVSKGAPGKKQQPKAEAKSLEDLIKKKPAKGKEAPAKPSEKAAAKSPAKSPTAQPKAKKAAAKPPPAKASAKKPAKPAMARKPAAKPSAKPAAKPAKSAAKAKSSKAGGAAGMTLTMKPPWQPWKPTGPEAQNVIAAFTQKGVADVAAFRVPIPKNITPQMRKSQIGQQAISAMLKQELSKRFKQIDKWKPMHKTIMVDGNQAIETTCTLKEGTIAGTKTAGEAVCIGIMTDKTGYLVTYRVPEGSKKEADVRKAVLAGIQLN